MWSNQLKEGWRLKKDWRHMLDADVISFFVTRKCQKIQKIDENSLFWRRKSSYLLNNLRHWNEFFRKYVTDENIKNRKKAGLHSLSEIYIFGKITGAQINAHCLFKLGCLRAIVFNFIAKLEINQNLSPN